ncbi:MAG: sulfatase [Planctomycetaceae bacterium]|nr:sulfatase [Planctomycetaceae bacterium]
MRSRFSPRHLARFTAAALIGAVLSAPPSSLAAPDSERRPNIVVIVADDLGYGDLGIHGGDDVPTPNIDSLARDGVRCTDGYVSCPVCSPTRAGLLTGRYQQRFGHEFNPGPGRRQGDGDGFGLPLDQVTLANLLKQAGYRTGLVGKWHLGYAPDFRPQRRGFDEFFGFLGGAHKYFPGSDGERGPIYRGAEVVDEQEYLTDAFGREAVAFVERHAHEPFFLFLTFNAVHNPLEATDKYLDRFPSISEAKRKPYAAMLSALDDNVGRVLDTLHDKQLDEHTLVFFISDNGGPTQGNGSRNTPLRGDKGTVWEGGIRVPYLVRWKGHLPPGKVYAEPVISLDILPTAAAVAGATIPPGNNLDGVDLLPYLTGQKSGSPHERLYWRFGPQHAVRQANFKLVKTRDGEPQLFDLAKDVSEQNNLAASRQDVLQQLTAAFATWNGELAQPRWEPQGGRRAGQPGARRAGRKNAAEN